MNRKKQQDDEAGRRNDSGDEHRLRVPATVKDIAERAGVSIGTVDRVLHHRGRVSPETTKRVREAVVALRYSPNLAAKHLSKAERRQFGVLVPWPEEDGGYWRQPIAGIEAAVQQLAHHYLGVSYFCFRRSDADSFRTAADKLLAAGVDGVLLAPTLYEPALELIARLEGTPCVVFDGELPGAPVLTTVSQDSFESGLLAGKLLKLLAPAGPYLTVTIGAEDYHLRRRREGLVAFFERTEGGQVEHLSVDAPAENDDQSRCIGDALSERGKVGGVFVTNALAHHVARALNDGEEPRMEHTPIIGYDLIRENRDCLQRGRIDFIIHQEPQRQGFSSLYTLYRRVVLGESVEPRIAMPIDIIMRENLGFYPEAKPAATAENERAENKHTARDHIRMSKEYTR